MGLAKIHLSLNTSLVSVNEGFEASKACGEGQIDFGRVRVEIRQ